MNLLNKKILYLILVLSFNLTNAQDNNVILNIETNNENAGLFIDDKFIGIGNTFNIEFKKGNHSIYLVEDIKQWNAEIIRDTIQVDNSENIFLNYDFTIKKVLKTIPEDVYVYKKDSLIGFTPTLIEKGFKELKLEKPEYSSIFITPTEFSSGQKPELNFIGEPPHRPFYGSTLFNILLGTAIALGATTAYLKLEADDIFDEYVITGNPELVSDIDHYDNISAATFVALQLNVALIIYFFLSE